MNSEHLAHTWKQVKSNRTEWEPNSQMSDSLSQLIQRHQRATSGALISSFLLIIVAFHGIALGYVHLLEFGLLGLMVAVFLYRAKQERAFKSQLQKLNVDASPVEWIRLWSQYYHQRKDVHHRLSHATPILLLGIASVMLNATGNFVSSHSYRIGLMAGIILGLALAYGYFRSSQKKEVALNEKILDHFNAQEEALKD